MGLESNNGGNGSVNFLSIVYGGVWVKSDDVSHPNYRSETHVIAGDEKVKSGLKFDSITGYVTKVSIRESEYGKELQLELTDNDNMSDKYVIGYTIEDKNGAISHPKFNAAKDAMSALIIIDVEKPLMISAWTDKGGFQKIGYKQDGKAINVDPSWTPKEESKKYYIDTPESALEILMSVDVKGWDEIKILTPLQKLTYFSNTLTAFYDLVAEFVTPKKIEGNETTEEKEERPEKEVKVKEPEVKVEVKKEEVKKEVAAVTPKETPKERLLRLKAERAEAAKSKKDAEDADF